MIDKVDIRVPSRIPLVPEFSWIEEQLRRTGRVDRSPASQHYRAVVDLRGSGISALLHAGLKHGKEGNHKLEIIEAGQLSYQEILHAAAKVLPVDPGELEIIRVDLCADVLGVPVSWFVEAACVKYKRFGAALGTIDFQRMGRAGVETVYFGKRPNTIRIYNKTAELIHKYGKLVRLERRSKRIHAQGMKAGIYLSRKPEIPTFEEWSGVDEDQIWTRVERQIGGGRVPCTIDTLGKLAALEDFNPFSNLDLRPGGLSMPKRQDYPLDVFMAGSYVRQKAIAEGRDATVRWLRQQAGHHAARTLKTYEPFLPTADGLGITSEDLLGSFRESTRRQLLGQDGYLVWENSGRLLPSSSESNGQETNNIAESADSNSVELHQPNL